MPSPTDAPRAGSPVAGALGARLFGVAALLAGLAVAAGAFGAHALEGRLSPDLLETFDTAARYHLSQSLGALLLAVGARVWGAPSLVRAGWMVVGGTLIFSGSLYVLVFSGLRWLGAVTPLGGVLLIGGWISAALVVFATRETRSGSPEPAERP